MKKKFFIALIIILGIYLLVWGLGELKQFAILKYDLIKKGGTYDIYVDNDGYSYSVALPYFMEFTGGNLAISPPLNTQKNSEFDEYGNTIFYSESALIIWLKPFDGGIDEIGALLVEGSNQRQVYLDDSKKARYLDDQEYVDRHQDEIIILFEKAEKMWDLEMPWGK